MTMCKDYAHARAVNVKIAAITLEKEVVDFTEQQLKLWIGECEDLGLEGEADIFRARLMTYKMDKAVGRA